MADDVEVKEKITVDTESAEKNLGRLSKAAKGLGEMFEGVGEIAATLGGIGAAWKIGQGLEEANNLYAAVDRISSATGVAADDAHAMFEAFERAGVDLDSAESLLTSMAKSASKVEGSMSITGQQAGIMTARMTALGISVKDGPVNQLLEMSKAAQAGKLSLQDLTLLFGVQRGNAERVMDLLKHGPEELRATFEEVKKSGVAINADSLESFRRMREARNQMKAAWSEVSVSLYTSLLPIVTGVLTTMKGIFNDIRPIVDHIGGFLKDHMEAVVALTKTWLALMAANKVANMFGKLGGAESMPLALGEGGGRIGQLLGMLRGAAPAAAAAPIAAEGAQLALPGLEAAAPAIGEVTAGLGGMAAALGPLALVAAAVMGAFYVLKNDTLGLRTALVNAFGGIWENLKGVAATLIAVFGKLWAALQPLVAIVGTSVVGVITVLAKYLEFLSDVVMAVANALVAIINAVIWALNKIPWVSIDKITLDSAKASSEAAKPKTDDKAKGGTYQDFRGSKFDITNNFSKETDGGRVAVAFGDSLAKLGERRLDSGLRPLYGLR